MSEDKITLFLKKYSNVLPPEAISELNLINDEYNYLKKIFTYSDLTISLVDEEGTYLLVNPKMETLVGNVVGKKIGSLSKKIEINEMLNFLKNNPHEIQYSKTIESIIQDTHKIFLIQMTRVNSKFLLMGTDITELDEIKKHNEFNERMIMLGEMSSFIVHEINNPLSSISMSAELIEMMTQGTIDIKKINQPLSNISNMVENISKIISTLKSFSRKEDSLEQKELSFKKIYEQSLMIVNPKLKNSYINISSEIDDSSLIGKEIEFLQVLVNLISNSIDAIKNNEKKWIKVIWKNEKLKVIDSGNGIDNKTALRLFEKFHTTKGSKGNGIGLYLSREILNKNGYELSYQKEGENTCFCWNKKAA